jgi:cyclophilin family peptidyl-prolyl cis-trans isomerase/HEAT repeat protein
MRRYFYFFALLSCPIVCARCTPPGYGDDNKGVINLNLRDKQVQRLYTFRDEHQTDSLKAYLTSKNATLRYLAALSFASLRDSSAAPALHPLLTDATEEVRIAAAFALGQIGRRESEKPLIESFVGNDTASLHQRFNAVVLEAVGKCGSMASLKNIAAVSTYKSYDTLLLEGQCRAIYRFGLRDSVHPAATARMVAYVYDEQLPASARLMAAHYLARTKNIAPDSAQAVMMAAGFVRASGNPDIQMALATALGKSATGPAFGILSKVIGREQDWRVRCNLIRALAKFDYDTVRALVTPLLRNANPHVSRTAAEFFVENGRPQDGDYYWRIARDNGSLPMLSQIALYRASNKFLSGKTEPESKDYVNFRLKEIFQQSKNPYERAACLNALAEFGWNYRWIHDKGFPDAHPAVKSAAAEALKTIAERPNFFAFFGEAAKGARREIYAYLRELVAAGDAGMIAAGATAFTAPALNFRTLRDSVRLDDLKIALSKLNMPRDVEAAMALDEVIAWFEGQPKPTSRKIPWNHPIDWNLLKTVSEKTEATLATSKGKLVLELYPGWAPGSVANFIALAQSGEYDGKNFHRVVPNYVIQGGCPRGDGYGALDYTLRTEIGLAWYDREGYLGMASAGADTEGTQFFITHSATPQLDGRYTIFGRVKSGMEVVHNIQPGDVIEKVTIQM